MHDKLTTGMTWVTPSPLSMTVPVSVLSPTCLDVQEAARARTACNNTAGDVKVVGGYNNIHVLDGMVLTAAGIYHLRCIGELLGLVSLIDLLTTFPMDVLLFVLYLLISFVIINKHFTLRIIITAFPFFFFNVVEFSRTPPEVSYHSRH